MNTYLGRYKKNDNGIGHKIMANPQSESNQNKTKKKPLYEDAASRTARLLLNKISQSEILFL
jgi:hypothetical protein